MRVLLHPALEMSGNSVVDLQLGVRYFLTPDAAWLLGQLRREPCVEVLVPAVARHQRISLRAAQQATYALLGLLDTYGGIQKVEGGSSIKAPWNRRYVGNLKGFIHSMRRAYGLLLLCTITLSVVCMALLHIAFDQLWVTLSVGTVMTCVVHEAGHVVAARLAGVRFVLLARPFHAAILYARPCRQIGRRIAYSGPLAAVLFCLAYGMMSNFALDRALWAAAGVLHACSLLPFFEDGKTIWRNT